MRHARRSARPLYTNWLALAPLAAAVFGTLAPDARADGTTPPAATAPTDAPPPASLPRVEVSRDLENKVLVLAFQPVDPQSGAAWVGRSVQQGLVTDLATGGPLPVGSSSAAPADASAAAEAGRQAGARYVVFGQVHTINFGGATPAVRVTGQVVDAGTGQAVTSVKSTAMIEDLFSLEDDLGDQLRRRLARVTATPAAEAAPAASPQADAPPEIPYSGPVTTGAADPNPWYDAGDNAPAAPRAPYARYYYGNPYAYGLGYPYYGSYYVLSVPSGSGVGTGTGTGTGTTTPNVITLPPRVIVGPGAPFNPYADGTIPPGGRFPGPRGPDGRTAVPRAGFGHIFAPQPSQQAAAQRRTR